MSSVIERSPLSLVLLNPNINRCFQESYRVINRCFQESYRAVHSAQGSVVNSILCKGEI
jgi:hypothetical protein